MKRKSRESGSDASRVGKEIRGLIVERLPGLFGVNPVFLKTNGKSHRDREIYHLYYVRHTGVILIGIPHTSVHKGFKSIFLVTPIFPLPQIFGAPNRVYFVSGSALIDAFPFLEPSLRAVMSTL